MKKVLFIDRDGTIIIEPPDQQIDSLEKLEFYPGVFTWLGRISREAGYELVMVTNQDGLGTKSFPEETFWPAHDKMMRAFEKEGVRFSKVFIDRTFPQDNQPTRKPGTGMLTDYMNGSCDLKNSFVIGDRITDLQLAKNLGAKGIFINDGSLQPKIKEADLENTCSLITANWENIYKLLTGTDRKASVIRTTKETDIKIDINLDGNGKSSINTGLGFFDHMLDQLSKHGNLDLAVVVKGDLHINDHHMKILGLKIIGNQASSAMQAVALLISMDKGIEELAECVHPHPSITEGIQECVRMLLGKSLFKPDAMKGKLSCRTSTSGVYEDIWF